MRHRQQTAYLVSTIMYSIQLILNINIFDIDICYRYTINRTHVQHCITLYATTHSIYYWSTAGCTSHNISDISTLKTIKSHRNIQNT